MRIILVATEYSWPDYYGGIKTYTHILAKSFVRAGHEVHIITDLIEGIERNKVEDGVLIHHIGTRRILPYPGNKHGASRAQNANQQSALTQMLGAIHLFRRSLRVNSEVARIAHSSGADIVEVPDWGAEGLWLTLRPYIPIVVTLHGPSFWVRNNNNLPATIGSLAAEYLEKKAILGATAIVSPSSEMRRLVSNEYRLPALEDRIFVISNPIDTSLFKPDTQGKRLKENGVLTITYVGRLEFRKGVHVLAAAIPTILKEHPEVKIRFIGSDTPTSPAGGSMQAYISDQLKPYMGAIEFTGPLPTHTLPNYYAGSALVVVPSLHESFGLTCAEAMACGACVVASQSGGLLEIVQDKITGYLVSPGDEDSLAKAVVHLLAHPDERREIGMKARETIVERMSIERVAAQKLQLYQQVIARHNSKEYRRDDSQR